MSRFGLGVGYGTLSYKIVPAANPEPIRVGLTNFDFKGRWFPFAGSFFLGGSVGREILYATTHRTFTIPDVPVLGFGEHGCDRDRRLQPLEFHSSFWLVRDV